MVKMLFQKIMFDKKTDISLFYLKQGDFGKVNKCKVKASDITTNTFKRNF